jgi:hypothetical protein
MHTAKAATVALLAFLAIGAEAAAKQGPELSADDSPLVFRPGGKAPVEQQHAMVDGSLLGQDWPTYIGAFTVEPEVSQLTIVLERLGPPTPGVTRSLSLDEKTVEGFNARNFAYIDCRYDACTNYQIGDGGQCAAFSLDERATPDQWRPARYDRLQGFLCTKRKAPVTAEMIDRVLADLTVRAQVTERGGKQ